MKDRGTKHLKKTKIKSGRIFDLTFLQHMIEFVISESAIRAASKEKFFTEKEQNILRQKDLQSTFEYCMNLHAIKKS